MDFDYWIEEDWDEIRSYIKELEESLYACQKEIEVWRNWYLDDMPIMINEDRDKRIRKIFLNTPSKSFQNLQTPSQLLDQIVGMFTNASQEEVFMEKDK